MRRLLSIIISLITVMAFAQQPVESTSNESDPMLRIGKSYLGTRYVANTLDRNEVEQLVINTKEVDCLTFVEYTLAQALGSSFADNLQRIRYRDGIINGYPSRLHYTSDWIDNGLRNGFLTDVTARNSSRTTKLSLSYMSTHPKQYKKLADSPENVTQMAEYEKALSGKTDILVAEKRITGKRITLDYERRYYRYHYEASRTGHSPCGNSLLRKRKTASAARFFHAGKSGCQREAFQSHVEQ